MSSEFKKEMIKHWHSFKNPLINDVLINLTKLEKDLPQVTPEEEQAVEKLLTKLKGMKADQLDEKALIDVLNQLTAPYMLYIIHKLQADNNELVMKIINFAQKHRAGNPEIAKFFQRNMVFEKAQLFGRIFSMNRMQDVLDVL